MPRDKSESHSRIREAARKEFLTYGFREASMRRIAQASGLTASGLYKHFAGKEEMFAALVEPVIEEFNRKYEDKEVSEFARIENPEGLDILKQSEETAEIMGFIYDNLDEFRLIICRSEGTRFADFVHEVAKREEETTLRYMDTLRSKGIAVKEFSEKEFHLLVTTNVEAIMQAIMHDFTREEAIHYAKTLDEFFLMGWKKFFGI